jgi:2-desacetyl-2-hydroxyethyl bacteriochlorophyllide A dehydrogenase
VTACGICGTDLHVYRGFPVPWPLPGVRGHELSGIVRERAVDVRGVHAGDRVVVQPILHCGRCRRCRLGQTNLCPNAQMIGGALPGGHAQFVAVPAAHVFRVPDHLDLAQAALAETLATPVRIFRMHGAGVMQSVAVFGAGSQGLLSLQLARRAGAARLAVSDPVAHRRQLALALGAALAVDPGQQDPVAEILALTDGEGVDLAIEAAGHAATRQQAIQVLRPGGTAVFLALGSELTPVDFQTVSFKELNLRGSQAYTDSDFTYAIDLLADGAIQVDGLLASIPLSEGAATFAALASDPGSLVKVLLRPPVS